MVATNSLLKSRRRSLAGISRSAIAGVTRVIDRWRGARLQRDQARFLNVYRRLTARRFGQSERPPRQPAGATERQISAAVAALRRDGFAIWPGLLADEAVLGPLRGLLSQWTAEWTQAFAGQPANSRRVVDPQGTRAYTRSGYINNGRTRINFQGEQLQRAPDPIQAVAFDPRMAEVCSRYFDSEATCSNVLAERLVPSEEGDWWHIDRIVDQVKVMILLSDVGRDQGPLQFKAGTHRGPPELGPVYHQVFACGVDYAYPPGPLVERLAAATRFGTGRAGDCIFFDTLGIHSGTRCLTGERLALVSTFYGDTCKTRTLQRLSKQKWI